LPKISNRDLVLLLMGTDVPGSEGEIGGITRLQKLLFLLEREEGLAPTGSGFEFTAYKAGPYSATLYDDLEFLENLGLLQSEVAAEATDAEAAEVDLLDIEELLGESSSSTGAEAVDRFAAADAYEERRFSLSEKGLARVKTLLDKDELQPVVEGIRKVKSRFGSHSLNDLLYYVYTKYPEMAVESEIKDKVLRKRHRH
jgi:uncharacterized protein YwgA